MDSTRRIVRGGGTGLTSSSRFSALLLYEHEKRIKRLKRGTKMVPIRTDHGKRKTFPQETNRTTNDLDPTNTNFLQDRAQFVCSFSNSFTLQTSEPDRRSC